MTATTFCYNCNHPISFDTQGLENEIPEDMDTNECPYCDSWIGWEENSIRNKQMPVGQYDKNWNLIRIFKSQQEAGRILDLDVRTLNYILNRSKTKYWKGFYWKKEKKHAI